MTQTEIDWKMKWWVYDIECFANFFCANFLEVKTGERKSFRISKPNLSEFTALKSFYQSKDHGYIGFNILGYDHIVMTDACKLINPSARDIKKISNSVISSNRKVDGKNLIDIFYIMHFDNDKRWVSLKSAQGVLRWHKIQDLPYEHNKILNLFEQDQVVEYCWNDVDFTKLLFDTTKPKIKSNFKISKMYGLPSHNWSDSKMGEQIIIRKYQQRTGKKITTKTYRSEIHIKDVIPSYIKFEHPRLKELLDLLKGYTIRLLPEQGIFLNPFNMNVTIGEKTYSMGNGGLHSIDHHIILESNENQILIDKDVTSMYPNICYKNEFYPEHLGPEFCIIMGHDIIGVRTIAKARYKDPRYSEKEREDYTTQNFGLKLSANSAYGKTKSIHSDLYDPQTTMAITYTGQLSLFMLIEKVVKHDIEIVSANTDGVLFYPRKDQIDLLEQICKEWEETTQLVLEEARYQKYYARDVNNYIAIYEGGKVKEKGQYDVEKELGGQKVFFKNHSHRIIPLAVRQYVTKGIPIETTIRNHNDIFDFCLLSKATKAEKKGQSKFYLEDINGRTPLGKTIRYYASKKGGTLIKSYEDGSETVITGRFIDFTNAFEKDDYEIDYSYYIKEARKLLIDKKPTLF